MIVIESMELLRRMLDDYERNDMFYPACHEEALKTVSSILKDIDNLDSICFHNGWCKPDWFCADAVKTA